MLCKVTFTRGVKKGQRVIVAREGKYWKKKKRRKESEESHIEK